MESKYLKKEIRWFRTTELNVRKTQEKAEPEEKVIVLNAKYKIWSKNNGKLFKDECNNYGYRA